MIRILKNLSLRLPLKLPRKRELPLTRPRSTRGVDYAEGFTVERYLAVNSLGIWFKFDVIFRKLFAEVNLCCIFAS
jgi:hypothetical protein